MCVCMYVCVCLYLYKYVCVMCSGHSESGQHEYPCVGSVSRLGRLVVENKLLLATHSAHSLSVLTAQQLKAADQGIKEEKKKLKNNWRKREDICLKVQAIKFLILLISIKFHMNQQ